MCRGLQEVGSSSQQLVRGWGSKQLVGCGIGGKWTLNMGGTWEVGPRNRWDWGWNPCHTSIQRGCRLVPKCIDYNNNTGVVPTLLMYYYSPLHTYWPIAYIYRSYSDICWYGMGFFEQFRTLASTAQGIALIIQAPWCGATVCRTHHRLEAVFFSLWRALHT